ncbi:MAG TPA: chromosomal replication initiator protein DnaA [Egibacteraceae bacterium]|nr:chromosomal replication initiator protein DnaA [Egibacteraceae bacterium]
MESEGLWNRALSDLRERVSGAALRTWLDQLRPVGYSDDTVVLAAPDNLSRARIADRYTEALQAALTEAAGRPVEVLVTVRPPESAPRVDALDAQAPRAAWGPEEFPRPTGDRGSLLNPKYTFDRFVIGASNRFAHAAAFAVAEAPAKAYNPLFIYGGAGLGKTHLLQAVGHYTTMLYPSLQCRYVTSEQFTNEFIDAISNGRQVPFQRRYRDVDVLLIDDIQFLESKERTQEEFFHTFNALHTANKQIVISSDRPPKQIGRLEERLRTRFEWGLTTDIQPPDLETRLAILRKKSGQEGLVVPDEVLELIASRISSNIRELEGALIRVTAAGSLQHTEVNLHMAQLVLKDLFPDAGSSQIGVSLIMSETAAYYGFTLEELCSGSRTRQLVNARQIAMYLTRELTDLSLPKIGQAFGGRDHTTVIHANNKISGLMQERPAIYQQLQELTSRVKTAARQPR